MMNATLQIPEKVSPRALFEQQVDSYLKEVKVGVMVNYDQDPQSLRDPFTMLGRLEKEAQDVKNAVCERNASELKRQIHELVSYSVHCAINSRHVRSVDLI